MTVYYFISRLLSPIVEGLFFLYSILTKTPRSRLVVRNEAGEILLLQAWPNTSVWGLPGGGVDKGETPEEAAVRELSEETGIRLPPEEVRHSATLRTKGHKELVFLANAPKAGLPPVPPNRLEVRRAGWFSLSSLPEVSAETKRIVMEVTGEP